MPLEPTIFLNGILSIIFVAISTFVGLSIASKYFKYKDRTLLFIGFSWCGMCIIWWSISISFLLILFTDKGLDQDIYIIIGYVLIPIFLESWLIAFTHLKYKQKRMIILIIFAILGVLYEILLFYFYFTDISMIATLSGPVDVKYGIFMISWLLFVIILVFITGNIFARESLKSDNPQIKLKGKLLMGAFNSYVIGSAFSIFSNYSIVILIIARITVILASILFYFGIFGGIEESEEIESIEEIHDTQEFLELVARHKHKKLTEEDVKFYREQTICLVCKTLLIGYTLNFICFECRALYCAKCARAISKLENTCWACNNPIDKSKPVKLPEAIEEEIPMEDIPPKKKIKQRR